MKLIDSLRLVWRNLWRMKVRTILTSIGVMIGTGAIVAMMSLSIGLKDNAVKSLENWGNLTELEIHSAQWNPETQTPIPPDQVKQLNWESVAELKQIEGVSAVMPSKRLQAQAEIKLGRLEGHVEIIGVDVREAGIFKGDDVEKGSFLTGPANEIVISYHVPRGMIDFTN
jgi:acetoin utilization transport system permease protein